MKEITVKEFMELVKGGLYQVESVDNYSIYITMEHVRFSFDEDFEELTFISGTDERVTSEVAFKTDSIECITYDEESGDFTLEFDLYMADIVIRKAVQ